MGTNLLGVCGDKMINFDDYTWQDWNKNGLADLNEVKFKSNNSFVSGDDLACYQSNLKLIQHGFLSAINIQVDAPEDFDSTSLNRVRELLLALAPKFQKNTMQLQIYRVAVKAPEGKSGPYVEVRATLTGRLLSNSGYQASFQSRGATNQTLALDQKLVTTLEKELAVLASAR